MLSLSLTSMSHSLSLSLSVSHIHTSFLSNTTQHIFYKTYCLSDSSRQNGLKFSPRTHVGLASTVADCQFLLHLLFLDNAFDFKDKLALLLVWASKKVILLDVNHR